MAKSNSPKSQYNDIINKQPPKIIKASKFMNIITIACAVVFITLLVLKWTNVFIAPPLLLWSPVIVFGAFFLVIVVWMMKVMLTEGLVKPMTPNRSTSSNSSNKNAKSNIYNRPNMTHGHGSHSATKKKKKRKK